MAASTTQTVSFTIDRAPTLGADSYKVVESASVSGTAGTAGTGVLGNDSDKDGDSLSVSAVNGSGANVGSSTFQGTYGHLNLAADGHFTYAADNTSAIDSAATGAHLTDSFRLHGVGRSWRLDHAVCDVHARPRADRDHAERERGGKRHHHRHRRHRGHRRAGRRQRPRRRYDPHHQAQRQQYRRLDLQFRRHLWPPVAELRRLVQLRRRQHLGHRRGAHGLAPDRHLHRRGR